MGKNARSAPERPGRQGKKPWKSKQEIVEVEGEEGEKRDYRRSLHCAAKRKKKFQIGEMICYSQALVQSSVMSPAHLRAVHDG